MDIWYSRVHVFSPGYASGFPLPSFTLFPPLLPLLLPFLVPSPSCLQVPCVRQMDLLKLCRAPGFKFVDGLEQSRIWPWSTDWEGRLMLPGSKYHHKSEENCICENCEVENLFLSFYKLHTHPYEKNSNAKERVRERARVFIRKGTLVGTL